ncbi:hypothetical protein WJX72_006804 [[Myrmecia] bisecta]|uniref:Uncharacterized protein n=1 Tax=[Myrmecia] bisecta TaxID=41462 RepID=A0AAW1PEU0_9CHLO
MCRPGRAQIVRGSSVKRTKSDRAARSATRRGDLVQRYRAKKAGVQRRWACWVLASLAKSPPCAWAKRPPHVSCQAANQQGNWLNGRACSCGAAPSSGTRLRTRIAPGGREAASHMHVLYTPPDAADCRRRLQEWSGAVARAQLRSCAGFGSSIPPNVGTGRQSSPLQALHILPEAGAGFRGGHVVDSKLERVDRGVKPV